MDMAIWLLLHSLALLGMAGVWLLPVRIGSVFAQSAFSVATEPSLLHLAAALLYTASLLLATAVAANAIPLVLKCLYSARCGPNRGSGIFALAFFGASVAQMEFVRWLAQRVFRGK